MFFTISGCLPGPYLKFRLDVTNNETLWKQCNFKYKGIYKLKEDVFIEYYKPFNFLILGPTLEYVKKTKQCVLLFYTLGGSLKDYQNNPKKYEESMGIVQRETKIQIMRIEKYVAVGYGGHNNIFATIIDGPFAGKEVEITDLTIGENSYIKNPNPELLSLVDNINPINKYP